MSFEQCMQNACNSVNANVAMANEYSNSAGRSANDASISASQAALYAAQAGSIVIPTNATYGIVAIDNMLSTTGLLIWKNTLNLNNRKIRGIN